MWQPQIKSKETCLILSTSCFIYSTNLILSTCNMWRALLASSCCSLYDYKALWRPHLTLTTQSTTMVTILAAHMFLLIIADSTSTQRESNTFHSINTQYNREGQDLSSSTLVAHLSLHSLFYSDTRTRLQHTLSILLQQQLFDAIPRRTHSKHQQKSSSVSGGHVTKWIFSSAKDRAFRKAQHLL